jgi:hypothetical protein
VSPTACAACARSRAAERSERPSNTATPAAAGTDNSRTRSTTTESCPERNIASVVITIDAATVTMAAKLTTARCVVIDRRCSTRSSRAPVAIAMTAQPVVMSAMSAQSAGGSSHDWQFVAVPRTPHREYPLRIGGVLLDLRA